jgi:hypothetical protein
MATQEEPDPQALVPLYWPEDYLQADAIRQALQGESIPCHLDGENQASWVGAGPIGNTGRWRMRLLVRAMDLERARQLIEEGEWPTYT